MGSRMITGIKMSLALAGGIALGAVGLLSTDQILSARHPPHRLEKFDRLPNVWLTTDDGRKVRFYDDLVRGKIVAINFFYSACTEF